MAINLSKNGGKITIIIIGIFLSYTDVNRLYIFV